MDLPNPKEVCLAPFLLVFEWVLTELKAAVRGKPRVRAKGHIGIHHSQEDHCCTGKVPGQTGSSLQSFLSGRAQWPAWVVITHPSVVTLEGALKTSQF